jgi:hypothetical protein
MIIIDCVCRMRDVPTDMSLAGWTHKFEPPSPSKNNFAGNVGGGGEGEEEVYVLLKIKGPKIFFQTIFG